MTRHTRRYADLVLPLVLQIGPVQVEPVTPRLLRVRPEGIMSEDRLAQAAPHVWENERRIAKQATLIERLETDGHVVPAMQARKLLATFQSMNAVARDHLRIEREKVRDVVIKLRRSSSPVTHFAPGFGNYGAARALSRCHHELDTSMRGCPTGPRFFFAGHLATSTRSAR